MYNAKGSDRFKLVPVPQFILSSYSDKPLFQLAGGKGCPDVVDALEALITECPWLRVTDFWRDVQVQAAARAKYECWVAAGKPAAGTTSFNSKTMKAAYVAVPGKSMHNGGRAFDFDISVMLEALGKQYLDAFWPIAKRHGFSPVIPKPTEGVAESWHFDHKGVWRSVFDMLGYEQGVLAANCAVGMAGPFQSSERRVQAHIARLGKNIGEIDGILGVRSREALVQLGISPALAESTKFTSTRQSAMVTVAEMLEVM